MWAIARDAAACDTPWGSLLEELRNSLLLTNWGGVTGLSGRVQERCFRPRWDVVLPGTLTHRVVAKSPFWLGEAAYVDQMKTRTTQLFFSGALCWKVCSCWVAAAARTVCCRPTHRPPQTLCCHTLFVCVHAPRSVCRSRLLPRRALDAHPRPPPPLPPRPSPPLRQISTIARDERALEAKCQHSYSEPGFLSRYSFGLRYEIFRRHRHAPGFKIYASDYPPSLPPRSQRRDLDDEILTSRYCLCPSGTGWGMRVYHVLVLGCVPVLTQHDGEHPPVAQAFDPELLDWESFAVVVRRSQIASLPALLESVDHRAKLAGLRRVWSRMIWRSALQEPLASRLPGPDAFESTMAALNTRVMQAARSPSTSPT